jgi:hypothetical protein
MIDLCLLAHVLTTPIPINQNSSWVKKYGPSKSRFLATLTPSNSVRMNGVELKHLQVYRWHVSV